MQTFADHCVSAVGALAGSSDVDQMRCKIRLQIKISGSIIYQ